VRQDVQTNIYRP